MAGDGLLDILGGPALTPAAATEAAPMVAFEKPHGHGERVTIQYTYIYIYVVKGESY